MTVIDTTPASQLESISFEIDLQHQPEKVWKAITDPGLLSKWLLPVANLQLKSGSPFTLKAPPQPGWDGTVHCQFVEIVPGRSLSYRWVVSDIDTVVTFTLTPVATGTRLSIVQAGFKPDQKRIFGGARYGWKMFGARLLELLA